MASLAGNLDFVDVYPQSDQSRVRKQLEVRRSCVCKIFVETCHTGASGLGSIENITDPLSKLNISEILVRCSRRHFAQS